MYLKSLEIHGFKSFADKTKLEFGPGITCIVGPNGSGKSNVCDALRWVLGEQSLKTLRGARLEDIIFNGSEGRRALGMANVTLLFDNSSGHLPLEFNEVTVTRRVYRSGESEFLINKVPCRLKDIQELFNDTGLGKEAFAIIGQGQVDAILSSRPEERRALFEEAAGIVRYRNRKQEATRKLDDTSTNLDRLQDLLYELEQNLPPLKEETEKAQLYESLNRELEALEVSLSCLELEKITSQQQKNANTENQLQSTIWEKESLYALLTADLEEIQVAKEKLEEQERANQHELYQLQNLLSKIENEKVLSQERIIAAEEREAAIKKEKELNQLKLEELEERFGQEQEQLEALAEVNGPQQEALTKGEIQLDLYQKELLILQEQGTEFLNNVFDVEQRLVSLKNRQLELQFELKSLSQQGDRLTEEEQRYCLHEKELKETLEVTTKELERKKGRLELCGQERLQIEEQKKRLDGKLFELREQREYIHQAQHAIRSRIRVLEEMRDNLEGYHAGVRNLFKGPVPRGELKILGVVGELLKVPPQYEKAIEMVLGGAVQYLVTEKDQDAQRAIDWLKQERAGRATFLPLNTLQPRKLAKEFQPLLGEAGVLGLASDLVQIIPGQEVVVDYLLGSIVVVANLTVGMALAKKSRYSLKIVTLDGDILFPGGSLTGGSQKRSGTGLLGRTREIIEQEDQLKGLEVKQQELQARLQAGEQEEKVLGEAEQKLREEIQRLGVEIKSQEVELERLVQELTQEHQRMESLRWQNDQLLVEKKSLLQELNEVDQEWRKGEERKAKLQAEIEQHKSQERSLQEKARDLEGFLMEQKVHLASQREKQKALESSLVYYQKNRQEALSLDDRLGQELFQLVQRKSSAEGTLSQLEAQVIQLMAEHQKVEKAQSLIVSQKQSSLATLSTLETKATQLSKELKELKEQYHKVEMQKARHEVEWENANNRLMEKFHLTWEEARERQLSLTSQGEAEEHVKIIRKEMTSLGVVNPNAPQEYERLEQRYQFLITQQQDLLEAREGLFQIIKEMESIMSQRFKETFQKVETAFKEVFSYLFGGGKASLELTITDNILESGIEIIAQPPGKKMQNLSLLSGGERALTAAALLFALLKIKPSPFCVLDEIEANLDEVNVDRFAQYLREFAAETQFIVVSHRQGTMEVADVLYGVTMEESGVSRLVSVKLAPAEEVS